MIPDREAWLKVKLHEKEIRVLRRPSNKAELAQKRGARQQRPKVLKENAAIDEQWNWSKTLLTRIHQILSSPRQTRKCRQGLQHSFERKRCTLHDAEALLQESLKIPSICERAEIYTLAEMIGSFITWRDNARKELASHRILGADQIPAVHEAYLASLVARGSEFPIKSQEISELALRLWICRAQKAIFNRTSLQDIVDLCDKSVVADAPDLLLRKLQEKRRHSEEWVTRMKTKLSEKCTVADLRALQLEAGVLGIGAEDSFLLEQEIKAAESWNARVQVQLARSIHDADYKALKSLLNASSRIAVRLDKVVDVEIRRQQLEDEQLEASKCTWAQCDACDKWRRLRIGQRIAATDGFSCQDVAKPCSAAEVFELPFSSLVNW